MNAVTMKTPTRKACLVLTFFFICSASVTAKQSDASDSPSSTKIRSKVLLGMGSDSNVAVDEIDSDLAVRDSLWSFSANVNYRQKLSPPTELKVGLGHSQDSYDNFSEFDLATNFVTADLSHEFDKVTIGTTLRHITADLDSQSFLSISRSSLYASILLSKKVFMRADYAYSDKKLNTFTDRNASQHSLGANLYLFLDGAKRLMVVSYKYQNEDTVADRFDRQTHHLRLRYKHTFSIFEQPIVGQLKASYRVRDYDAITPSIGLIRHDERIRLGADLKFLLPHSLFAMLEYEYSDYQSNLPAVDYEQSIVALKIGWQFSQ